LGRAEFPFVQARSYVWGRFLERKKSSSLWEAKSLVKRPKYSIGGQSLLYQQQISLGKDRLLLGKSISLRKNQFPSDKAKLPVCSPSLCYWGPSLWLLRPSLFARAEIP
jgi:hypothetical protein